MLAAALNEAARLAVIAERQPEAPQAQPQPQSTPRTKIMGAQYDARNDVLILGCYGGPINLWKNCM